MRLWVSGALQSVVLTFVAVLALRSSSAAAAIAAVAGVTVLLSWYAQLSSSDDVAGLDVTNAISAVTLAVVGRRDWADLLPLVTAQVIGAVAAGLAGLGLEAYLPEPIAYDANGLVTAAVGGAIVGLVGAWATLVADGGGPIALVATPVLIAGALPLGLIGTFSPAVMIGLAASGLIGWTAAAVAAVAGVAGAAAGAFSVSALLPDSV